MGPSRSFSTEDTSVVTQLSLVRSNPPNSTATVSNSAVFALAFKEQGRVLRIDGFRREQHM